MLKHVTLQASEVGKGFVTLLALIRLFTRVGAVVYCEVATLCKPSIAMMAHIWLFTRMRAQVSCQVALL